MIDTNQLSALVSAFRVETEKESISPETVGKLLQDSLDLLTTANSDTERKYYASVMRIKEFYEENVGKSFTGILSDFARNVNNRTQSGSV